LQAESFDFPSAGDAWMRLRAKNHPFADKALTRSSWLSICARLATFGPDTLTAAFYVCNRGLKKLR
jgi:hypothetical protein